MTYNLEVMVPVFVWAAMIGFCVHLVILKMRYCRLSVRQDELAARIQEVVRATNEVTARTERRVRETRERGLELERESEEITREAIMTLMRTLAEIELTPLEPVNVRLQPEEYRRVVTPIVGSSKHRKNPEDVETCAICQDVMEDGTTWHQIECGHRYHAVCLTRWLQQHCRLPLCPLCRFDVRETHKLVN